MSDAVLINYKIILQVSVPASGLPFYLFIARSSYIETAIANWLEYCFI